MGGTPLRLDSILEFPQATWVYCNEWTTISARERRIPTFVSMLSNDVGLST